MTVKNHIFHSANMKAISLLTVVTLLSSCATRESIRNGQNNTASTAPTRDGFASESVREAYLRLKKTNYTEEDKRIDIEESSKIARERSQSMVEGASTLDSLGRHSGKTYYLEGAEELNLENNYFDIPVVYNAQVKKWLNYFLNRGRPFFQRYTERAGRYAPILGAILEEHGLPRDLIFLAMAESGFNNVARSWAAAVGPWQFMPYTGRVYGLEQDWYRDERRDPIKATVAAARYLTKLYGDFGQWEVAAAAYNAGEGKLGRAIKKYKTEDFWDLTKGRYLKDETKNYVPKIMALAIIGKNLKSFGFEEIDFHEPLDFDEVVVKPSTDLIVLSQMMGVEFEEIQRLNPEILRWFTPPNLTDYRLRVPPGAGGKFLECCERADLVAKNFQKFTVPKSGMHITDISKRFKIRQNYVLAGLNNVSEKARFRPGAIVTLPFREGEVVGPNNNLYADLYQKPRREVLRRRNIANARKRARVNKARAVASKNQGRKIYTVKRGDTLFGVAQKHGTTVKRLIASNRDLIDASTKRIHAGDKLIIK